MSDNVWNRPSGSSMVDMGISSNIMKSPFPRNSWTWSHTVKPSIAKTFYYRDLVTELDLITVFDVITKIREVSTETLQRVRLANSGRLLLRTPVLVPLGTCICSNVETIHSWTCHVYGPFEFRTSLGTSILLYKNMYNYYYHLCSCWRWY